ncbi:MAG: ribonuclease III [Zetaproteobacteria bacterium CG12_big_fil_rev_8_21_14_0_65_54_13]|nr:MAG: ribonuclease III [Zetaproteobacteria bacterium CG12_big_fil_rev_8_21_14_0_65_54_13]PIX54894.1 MAG: ribonuclease III [Zetaproteobacteria bacterium CG_4_10_14_3_um_filter_54_28]PJA30361.1 MAG: ribonuclease III [Zetaproteobacteria bacterium CG_4_9_14_3_um_filter_54_145]
MAEDANTTLTQLQQVIAYQFRDPALLKRALTHCSALRGAITGHLERLEFLGDAVLGLVIAEYLHHSFPDKPEGLLSRMRASLVCRDSLLVIAADWHLSACLVVGEGERSARGVKSPSITANAVEAVIGAVFEDSGWDAARRIVLAAWQPMLADIGRVDTRDGKSRLQEFTQGKGWGLPVYKLTDRGAGANPRFEAACSVQDRIVGHGQGERKKTAEIAAAEQAWSKLKDE